MNRKEFIRNLAVLTVGANALPEQINLLEEIITINAIPNVNNGLICIDEINLFGFASRSHPMLMEIFTNDKPDLTIAANLFGGIYRWVAAPGHHLRVTTLDKVIWKAYSKGQDLMPEPGFNFAGNFRYIDQNGKYEILFMEKLKFNRKADGSIEGTLKI